MVWSCRARFRSNSAASSKTGPTAPARRRARRIFGLCFARRISVRARAISATITDRGDERIIEGHGSGPLDAFVDALRRAGIADIAVLAYHEHALGAGSAAQAAPYVEACVA